MSTTYVKSQQPVLFAPQYYTLSLQSMKDKRLSRADDHVLAVVSSFFMSTGVSFPTNSWIAERLNLNPLTVSRSISKLVKLGYLKSQTTNNRRYLSPPSTIPDPRDEMPYCELGKDHIKGEKNLINQSRPHNVGVNIPTDQGGVDKPIKGGIPVDQGGVDQLINHNKKYNNKHNNNVDLKYIGEGPVNKQNDAVAEKQKTTAESPELQQLAEKARISETDTKALKAKYGNEKLVEGLKYIIGKMTKGGIENPVGYLSAALSHGYAKCSASNERETRRTEICSRANELYSEEKQRQYNAEIEKLCDPNDWRDVLMRQHLARAHLNTM